MKIISCITLAAICFVIRGAGQTASAPDRAGDQGIVFATNECFAKGGIGIVNKSLYIVVKSGQERAKAECGENVDGSECVNTGSGHFLRRSNLVATKSPARI